MAKKNSKEEPIDFGVSSGQKARFTRLYKEIEVEAESKLKELKSIYEEFLGGSPSFQSRLNDLETRAKDSQKKISEDQLSIEEIHRRITEPRGEQGGNLADDIDRFINNYESRLSEIKSLREEFITFRKSLEGFDNANGQRVEGIKDKIQNTAISFEEKLKEYEFKTKASLTESEKKFSATKEKIDSLLPGASTVGIAEAFKNHKDSFKRPVLIWSLVFIGTLIVMIAYSLSIKSADINTFSDVWIQILNNLPFFLPAIWIAIYASKQQSQSKRLQQEYAFKEDVAKSYQGFKKEIENLDDGPESNQLKLEFMENLVHIIGENPTSTLESKSHKDKPPIVSELTSRFRKNDVQNMGEDLGGEE